MMRRIKKQILAPLATVVGLGMGGTAAATLPNLVVIMADDLSVDVIESLLADGLAPNIQQYLIDEGITFQNSFVTNALCCPSRTTFLRGQYSHSHKVFSNKRGCDLTGIQFPGWFPADGEPGRNESTIATWLSDAGYTTGFVGRYLNGYGRFAPEGVADPKLYIPPGWDDWQGLIDPSGLKMYEYELNDNGTQVIYGSKRRDYQTDVLAGRAVEFIEEQATGGTPFFLTVMPFAPHLEVLTPPCEPGEPQPAATRIRPAPRHSHLTDGDPSNGEVAELIQKPSFNEADVSDKPVCGSSLLIGRRCPGDYSLLTQDQIDLRNAQFKDMSAAMIAVDDLVGSVVQSLQDQGVFENSVIIFTSDNGWLYGEHRLSGKDLPYEESIRVPLYIRPAGGSSGIATQIVINNDLAPSLAELAGVTAPYDPDGKSFVPLLNDPSSAIWERRLFLVEHFYTPPGDFATLRALRYLSGSLDFLYVTTFSDADQPTEITAREFYHLGFDPYQEESFTLSQPITDLFDYYLFRLNGCQGSACRALEGFAPEDARVD